MTLNNLPWVLLLTGILGCNASAARAAAPIPELAAYRTAAAPNIDGKLDEHLWAQAPAAGDFWKLNGSAKAGEGTKAQVAFDDSNFYIAFTCPLKDAAAVKAVRDIAKDSVWNQETLEVFLAPFSDNQAYYHFALSPSNARYTEMNSAYPWSNPWESATSIGGEAWFAEIKIPFASLASVDGKSSPNWGLNLARGATMWAPTFDSYHLPAKFGRLTGIDAPLNDYRWLVAVGPGDMSKGPALALQLYHQAGRTLRVKYAIDSIESPDGKKWHAENPDHRHENIADRVLNVPVPITQAGNYTMQVSVRDYETGRPLAYLTTQVEGLLASRTVWDRSFYMTEPDALLFISSTNTGAAGGQVACTLRSPVKGAVLQTVNVRLNSKGQGKARFDLRRLAPGDYEVKLTGKNGLELDESASAPLKKLAAKRGAVQYTDTGILLRDGKPIFPFGVYYVRPYFARDATMAPRYARAGFNTYPMEWGNAESFVKEAIAQKANGLVPIVGLQNAAEVKAIDYNGPQTLDAWEKAARSVVKKVSAEAGDNILAWYTWDEPPLGLWGEVTKRFYNVARQEDPYHPTFLCSNNPGLFKTLAETTTDILGIDPYPGFPNGRVSVVGDWVDTAMKAAPNKPVVAVLQTFYEEGGRMPTPEELRCMTYLSIVRGARGVLYFSYDYRIGTMPEKEPETWKTLETLAGEMRSLEPSLVGKAVPGLEVQKTGGANIDFKLFGRYLIAVNREKEAAQAVFTVKGGKRSASLKLFGQERSVIVKNGGWSDDFGPYAVHIYEVK